MENKSLRVIYRREYREIHIQLIPLPGETARIFSEKISDILDKYNAKIVRATFFGMLTEKDNTIKHIENQLAEINFPYSWIEGENCTDSFINGVYILAVSGIDVKRIIENNIIVGSYFQSEDAEYCYLGGLYSDPDLSPSQQTSTILNSAENILNQAGLSFKNTIRTWYYLDDILDWYNDFNKARTSFFLQHKIFDKLVPASTGIGGKNRNGSKICLELNAIKPRRNDFIIEKVRSPLQCSAENYGSSFSRAVRYSDSEYSYLTVSGTASIDQEGKTMHVNDFRKQIELSFKIVKAILESQNYEFMDIIRAYAFCSDTSYGKLFYEYVKTSFPDKFAFICTGNKICRYGLLFEVEMDVIERKK